MKSPKDQLYWLKGMTERFGSVHEFQVYQLQCYGVLLPNVNAVEIKIEPNTHVVTFNAKSTGKYRKSKKTQELLNLISDWTQYILWNDSECVYILNDKKIYDSRIDKPDPVRNPDQTETE